MLVSVVRILSAILLKEKQTLLITLTDKSLKPLLLILKFSKKKKGKNSFLIAIGLYTTSTTTVVNWSDCHQNFQNKYTDLKEQEAARRVNWKATQQSQLRHSLAKKKSENMKSCVISRFLSQTSCKPYFTRQKFRTGN